MTSSLYPQITDELLSAYIDDAVTQEEKAIIEAAIVGEPAIAWRLETLRYTINLLNSLPAIALPHSFVLSELQMTIQSSANVVAQTSRQPVVARKRAWRMNGGLPSLGQSIGQRWRNFWQVGNLFLRNAAAVSLVIFLVLAASNEIVTPTAHPSAVMNTQSPARSVTMSKRQQEADMLTVQPTITAQASAPSASGNSQSSAVVQQTTTSQAAPEAAQATSASEPAPATADSLANHTEASSGVSAAAAPPLSDSTRAGATTSQPGPDDPAGGDQGFAPSPATNRSEISPNQSALQVQAAAAPKAAISSSQMKVQAAAQNTATLAHTTTVTTTIITTTTVAAYNTQRNAPVNAANTLPTPTPSAMKTEHLNNPTGVAQKVATSQANNVGMRLSWLSLAELISAGATLILCILWWRSSESNHLAGRQPR